VTPHRSSSGFSERAPHRALYSFTGGVAALFDGRHWAYRIVDGRECWYPGRPGKPKNELFWGHDAIPSARQPVDQSETEAESEPSEPPSRLVAASPEKPETIEAMSDKWRAAAAARAAVEDVGHRLSGPRLGRGECVDPGAVR
jgi:hypothetical protein